MRLFQLKNDSKTAIRSILLSARYFGKKKAARFAAGLPLALSKNAIVLACISMGKCTSQISNLNITWSVANPIFVEEIFEKRCYTPSHEFEIQSDFIIIDGGANIGTFTLLAAMQAKNGKVIAIESNHKLVQILQRNVESQKLKNVIILNALLDSKDGTSHFFEIPSGGSALEDYVQDDAKKVELESVSIQYLIRTYNLKYIDLLKLDIEGGEFAIFGNPSFLSSVRRIVMEVHPPFGNVSTILRVLQEYGFTTGIMKDSESGFHYLYSTKLQ